MNSPAAIDAYFVICMLFRTVCILQQTIEHNYYCRELSVGGSETKPFAIGCLPGWMFGIPYTCPCSGSIHSIHLEEFFTRPSHTNVQKPIMSHPTILVD